MTIAFQLLICALYIHGNVLRALDIMGFELFDHSQEEEIEEDGVKDIDLDSEEETADSGSDKRENTDIEIDDSDKKEDTVVGKN